MAAQTPALSISCEHRREIGCVLTALPACCACADQRPTAAAYPVYVDGQGMKMQGKRWARYCWKCRDFWNLSDTNHLPLSTTRNSDTATLADDPTRGRLPHHPRLPPETTPTPVPTQTLSSNTTPSHSDISSQPRPPVFPLGSREDVEQDDYQSPLAIMYGRAWDRFRTAEQTRQELAAQMAARTQQDHETPIWRPPPLPNFHVQFGLGAPPLNPSAEAGEEEEAEEEHSGNAIDRQLDRPAALSKEELTVSIACKMCLEQRIDTLVEPCMHLAMCRWCSEVWRKHARALRLQAPGEQEPWKCPMCRRGIKQVRRVYF